MKAIRKIFLPFFLLTLFAMYQVSITTFTHVHYVNGVMVVHSHPSSKKEHAHTAEQLVSICHLGIINTLKAEIVYSIPVKCPLLYFLHNTSPVTCLQGVYLTHFNLRAPPAVI